MSDRLSIDLVPNDPLFSPFNLGKIGLCRRVVHAPTTRFCAARRARGCVEGIRPGGLKQAVLAECLTGIHQAQPTLQQNPPEAVSHLRAASDPKQLLAKSAYIRETEDRCRFLANRINPKTAGVSRIASSGPGARLGRKVGF
jgi:hypothetical protein